MEEQYKPSKKLRIIFGILFTVGMISLIGMVFQESQAQEEIPKNQEFENSSSQTDDQIGKLIIVKINDGASSGDDLK